MIPSDLSAARGESSSKKLSFTFEIVILHGQKTQDLFWEWRSCFDRWEGIRHTNLLFTANTGQTYTWPLPLWYFACCMNEDCIPLEIFYSLILSVIKNIIMLSKNGI